MLCLLLHCLKFCFWNSWQSIFSAIIESARAYFIQYCHLGVPWSVVAYYNISKHRLGMYIMSAERTYSLRVLTPLGCSGLQTLQLLPLCCLEPLIIITVTSWLARCRKSSASRLFTQPFIQVQIKENIKAPRRWPLCGKLTGHRGTLLTKSQLREKCFHLMTSSWSIGSP